MKNENNTVFFVRTSLKGFYESSGSSVSVSYAVPQIDWEAISDHPLWKEGRYDEAVLDVMGLKWTEDRTGIVEK